MSLSHLNTLLCQCHIDRPVFGNFNGMQSDFVVSRVDDAPSQDRVTVPSRCLEPRIHSISCYVEELFKCLLSVL